MKMFVLGKRETGILAITLALTICFALLLPKGVDAVMTVSTNRKLPIYCVDTDTPDVALTFDAAWGNSDTDRLIEILAKYNAKATFFCTGEWVSKYPDDVSKLFAAGHTIANHSDKHDHIAALSREERQNDIQNCNEKIKAITSTAPELYRGPYGEYDNVQLEIVENLKMYAVQWDIDSRDWQKKKTASEMADAVCKNVKNGSIMLFHTDTVNTPEAVELTLKTLSEQGYRFVPVGDLIYKTDYRIDAAGCQHKSYLDVPSTKAQ